MSLIPLRALLSGMLLPYFHMDAFYCCHTFTAVLYWGKWDVLTSIFLSSQNAQYCITQADNKSLEEIQNIIVKRVMFLIFPELKCLKTGWKKTKTNPTNQNLQTKKKIPQHLSDGNTLGNAHLFYIESSQIVFLSVAKSQIDIQN